MSKKIEIRSDGEYLVERNEDGEIISEEKHGAEARIEKLEKLVKELQE